MPFSGQAHRFDDATLNTVREVGGVYGLCKQVGSAFHIYYVGLGENLRRRLREHYNNPPTPGLTHFFAEVHTTELARSWREIALIREFNPPCNVHHTR